MFKPLPKLKPGDKVAILSPSFAAPAKWPHVYELGLKRLRDMFELEPVEYPTTKKIGASGEERSKDLIDAFENPEIKAVIATLGGNDQVTYVNKLPNKPFIENPKPFFGYSDNSHFANFLWLQGIPSFYGGAIMTQFAMQQMMDDFTIEYLKHAFFDNGEFELRASDKVTDQGLNWDNPLTLNQARSYEPNEGWRWIGDQSTTGITWGGCLESIDEMLRHNVNIPSLEQFENIILMTETSEEMPDAEYVFRVYRALGERSILERIKGVLVGRPKAWEFDKPQNPDEKKIYRTVQAETIISTIQKYNSDIPIIQNINFGHTDPQIAMPYGGQIRIDSADKKIYAQF